MELSRQAEKHIKKMQYHETMVKKHKRQARKHYAILLKIFKNKELLKRVLSELGRENDLFNNPEVANERSVKERSVT